MPEAVAVFVSLPFVLNRLFYVHKSATSTLPVRHALNRHLMSSNSGSQRLCSFCSRSASSRFEFGKPGSASSGIQEPPWLTNGINGMLVAPSRAHCSSVAHWGTTCTATVQRKNQQPAQDGGNELNRSIGRVIRLSVDAPLMCSM